MEIKPVVRNGREIIVAEKKTSASDTKYALMKT